MRRGEIRLVSIDPVLGSEAARTRPSSIVSVPFHLMDHLDDVLRLHLDL